MTQLQVFQQNVQTLKYQEEQIETTRMWLMQNLRVIRKALRLSQPELAEAIGTAPCMVSQWEKGQRPIRHENMEKILTFFLDHVKTISNT